MERKPTKIILGGVLAEKFSPEWHLYVSSPAEAIRAIDANTHGRFRRFLTGEGAKGMYKVAIGKDDNALGADEIHQPSGENTIYILPVVAGASSGPAKIITGIILIVAAVLLAPYTGGTSLSWIPMALGSAGASLVIGGIVQMITPVPNFNDQNQSANDTRSNLFAGNATVISQGLGIPLVYGRMRVSPLPILLSFTATDQSAVGSFAQTSYEINHGAGGVVNFTPVPPDPTEDIPPQDENQP